MRTTGVDAHHHSRTCLQSTQRWYAGTLLSTTRSDHVVTVYWHTPVRPLGDRPALAQGGNVVVVDPPVCQCCVGMASGGNPDVANVPRGTAEPWCWRGRRMTIENHEGPVGAVEAVGWCLRHREHRRHTRL